MVDDTRFTARNDTLPTYSPILLSQRDCTDHAPAIVYRVTHYGIVAAREPNDTKPADRAA